MPQPPPLSEGYADTLNRVFPGTFLSPDPFSGCWRFCRRVRVPMHKPRSGLIIVPGQPQSEWVLVDDVHLLFWVKDENGNPRAPDERDLNRLYECDVSRIGVDRYLQLIDEWNAREDKRNEQKDRDVREERADRAGVFWRHKVLNVPKITPGIEFKGTRKGRRKAV